MEKQIERDATKDLGVCRAEQQGTSLPLWGFIVTAREALPYWINRADNAEAKVEELAKEVKFVRDKLAIVSRVNGRLGQENARLRQLLEVAKCVLACCDSGIQDRLKVASSINEALRGDAK